MNTQHRSNFPHRWACFLLTALCAGAAQAQQIEVATQRPPHFIGEAVLLRVAVSGFDEDPQPVCRIVGDLPGDLQVKLAGVSPQVSEEIRAVNGRFTRTRRVEFHFNYQVSSNLPGQYEIGPFEVSQGRKKVRADAVSLQFQDVQQDDNMRVAMELPDKPIYVGQRVPVTITWAYAGDLDAVRDLSIRSPLFEQFTFIDKPAERGDNILPIQTAKGEINLAAEVSQPTIEDQTFVQLSAVRTLVADRAGTFQLAPITASIRKVTRWSRDAFGDDFFGGVFSSRRRAAQTVPVRAVGEPLALVIKPLPVEGRPDSFAGAVGRGYSLTVQANRTVVRAGDPISLTLTLRGAGNLENAGVPSLSGDGGLPRGGFHVPSGDVAGVAHDGEKQFNVTVRVTNEAVDEIPALAYSWFDPGKEQYVTTRSKPIALRVLPAQVVSSGDVISAAGDESNGEAAPPSQSPASAGQPSLSAGDALSGADLAVELDTDRLLADAKGRFRGKWISLSMYALGMVMVALAVIDRRRRDVDPEIVRRRHLITQQRKRIKSAAELPAAEAAEEVAIALRTLVAETDGDEKQDAESLLARLETRIYAPAGTNSEALQAELLGEAIEVADRISRKCLT